MKSLKYFAGLLVVFASSAYADFGFNVGTGLPYTSIYGLNYHSPSRKFGAELSYNTINISAGLAKVSLTKPELQLKWHPFGGSFFAGLGIGQLTMSATGTDAQTGLTAKVTVTAMTLTPTVGWMWGVSDGGLFLGMDFGFQMPSGATTTIESVLPSTEQAYIDAVNQGNTLGSAAFPVFTLLRLGYLF